MASITLSAIAQQLGTSTVTVSNALNGKGAISPELRQKIIQTAQELGYQRRTKAKAVAPRAEGAQGASSDPLRPLLQPYPNAAAGFHPYLNENAEAKLSDPAAAVTPPNRQIGIVIA